MLGWAGPWDVVSMTHLCVLLPKPSEGNGGEEQFEKANTGAEPGKLDNFLFFDFLTKD